LFEGLNLTSMSFLVADALDTAAPTLDVSDCRPPTESPLSYEVPVTTIFRLTFNEPVQMADPGVAALTLTPKYNPAPDQIISLTGINYYIDDSDVMFFPVVSSPGRLLAGEVYTITVSSSAFMDVTGNPYGGLTSGWTISTKRQIAFVEATSTTGEWGAGINYFTGDRYGSAGVVDDSNTVYMIGGMNGTSGASSMLNDVWSYATKRETSCASSFVPLGACPQTTCSVGADGQPNLGSVATKKTVWRAPSASGAPCMDGATEVRNLWAIVTTEMQTCPCPMCLTAPGESLLALPTNMVNTSYVSAYTLVSAAPSMSTRQVHCADGFVANGSFTCVVDTPYVGKYQTPYPECIPGPCASPPSISGVANAAYMDVAGSSDGKNCSELNITNWMKDTGVCAIKCKAGYESTSGGFVCDMGNFKEATCKKKLCDTGIVSKGSISCGFSTPVFGATCDVKCNEGYRTSSSGVKATCAALTDDAESSVAFKLSAGTPSTVCEEITCTTPTASNGVYKLTSGQGVTSVWTLECNSGYMAVAASGILAKCSDGNLLNSLGEATLPSCTQAPECTGGDTLWKNVENAVSSTCSATVSDGETCKVTCEEGMEPTGNFVCLGGSFTGIATCFDGQGTKEDVQMVSAVLRMTLDLSGVTMDEAKSAIGKSLAAALGVEATNVIVDGITKQSGRRLDVSSQRRLQGAAYDISYQVIVPADMDASSLMSKATEIATPGSAVSAAFSSAMQSESLPVSGLELISAPQQYTATVVRSSDGGLVTPAPQIVDSVPTPAPPAPSPAPAEEESGSGAGAIIGGVIGGLFGLGIVGFLVYWFVIRKKSQQE
jgi:hypothetical protein